MSNMNTMTKVVLDRALPPTTLPTVYAFQIASAATPTRKGEHTLKEHNENNMYI